MTGVGNVPELDEGMKLLETVRRWPGLRKIDVGPTRYLSFRAVLPGIIEIDIDVTTKDWAATETVL